MEAYQVCLNPRAMCLFMTGSLPLPPPSSHLHLHGFQIRIFLSLASTIQNTGVPGLSAIPRLQVRVSGVSSLTLPHPLQCLPSSEVQHWAQQFLHVPNRVVNHVNTLRCKLYPQGPLREPNPERISFSRIRCPETFTLQATPPGEVSPKSRNRGNKSKQKSMMQDGVTSLYSGVPVIRWPSM